MTLYRHTVRFYGVMAVLFEAAAQQLQLLCLAGPLDVC